MSLEEQRHVLRIGKVPAAIGNQLEPSQLRTACVNLMLGVVEKMGVKELQFHMQHIGWRTMEPNSD